MSRTIGHHAAGAFVAWLVFVAQTPVIYAGLLVYAASTTGDLGGPLAGPVLCASMACLGIALVPLLFVPAGWTGEIASIGGRLSVKLLVSFAVAAVLAMLYMAGIAVLTDKPTVAGTLLACGGGAGAVLGPTAAYVLVAQRRLKTVRSSPASPQ
ncbi:hypothetical protein [Verrucosispora sp. WMMC514]|uniref:hypothetical protein n=1 Tax=Verrucosispora sp. WMMC514 TaxID=3015156 RepID=UPI00248C8362|nr:hypothetical protein [Verrucosispora sp. WMMC514]WBB93929.1 hypothetical protein O7597_13615 [Verrucosispora sp. WMMC514]